MHKKIKKRLFKGGSLSSMAQKASNMTKETGALLNKGFKSIKNTKPSNISKMVKNIKSTTLSESLLKANELKEQFKTDSPKLFGAIKETTDLAKRGVSMITDGSKYLSDKTSQLKDSGLSKVNSISPGIVQRIRDFLKTDFYYFIKYYLYFIVLFSICFYILININSTSTNNLIRIESKIFFYLLVIFLFIVISDILDSPLENLNKFISIIIFSLIIVYVISRLIDHFYKKDSFRSKLFKVFCASLLIFIPTVLIIYFTFQKKNKNATIALYNAFNYSMNKNIGFLIFFTIYLFLFYNTEAMMNLNTNLTDILAPSLLGIQLIFFIFCIIIFIALKMKLITKIQMLNTFLALFAICIFLGLNWLNIFMSSLSTICSTGETQDSMDKQEIVCLLIIGAIFIILWYDDERNWHQLGSILFVIVSLFTLYVMFYYSVEHPSTGLLSFWLFIEWLIIIFYRKENSKNSIHFSFMST